MFFIPPFLLWRKATAFLILGVRMKCLPMLLIYIIMGCTMYYIEDIINYAKECRNDVKTVKTIKTVKTVKTVHPVYSTQTDKKIRY